MLFCITKFLNYVIIERMFCYPYTYVVQLNLGIATTVHIYIYNTINRGMRLSFFSNWFYIIICIKQCRTKIDLSVSRFKKRKFAAYWDFNIINYKVFVLIVTLLMNRGDIEKNPRP